MRTDVATRRIAAFERRRGEAHLALACHCAVPLALTPDLTYRLWANFQRDVQGRPLRIPWVAVGDLLLSRLCEEAGDELYEMDGAIRQQLLGQLEDDPRFGPQRIGEVAEFLLQYVKQQVHSEDLDTRDFALAQEWNALAYTRPEIAAHELALALTAVDRRDRSELLRITSIVNTLSKPLESFDSLIVYADALHGFAQGNRSAAAALLDTLVDEDRQIHIAGATMTISHDLLPPSTERPPRSAGKRPAHPVRQRWALLVGVDHHDDLARPSLSSGSRDTLALQQTLNDLDFTTVALHNDATQPYLLPTRANIEGELARLVLAAEPDDLLLFFFSGHVLRSGPTVALVAQDSRLSMPPTMITTNAIESVLRQSRACDMVIILDNSDSQERDDRLAADTWPEFSWWLDLPGERRAALLATTGGRQGLFVEHLRDGLASSAVRGGKAYITVGDLYAYIRERQPGLESDLGGLYYAYWGSTDIPLVELTSRTAPPGAGTLAEEPTAQPMVPVQPQERAARSTAGGETVRVDFFISYVVADRAWAEWIAWQLEQTGYVSAVQAWGPDQPGGWIQTVRQAVATAVRTIVVLSAAYVNLALGPDREADWRLAFRDDPTAERGLLVPVRVGDVRPPELLGRSYVDLVSMRAEQAADTLLRTLRAVGAQPSRAPPTPDTTTAPPFPGGLPAVWNVPFLRNRHFIGRADLLEMLAARLAQGRRTAISQAATGMGGVGKTQLAAEYAYRYQDLFDVVWWVRAETVATLVADYAELATALELPERQQSSQSAALVAARTWLESNDRWLLILDNAPDPSTDLGFGLESLALRSLGLQTVVDCLPRQSRGQVVVTSRSVGWAEVADPIYVDVLRPDEAIAFLLARTGSPDTEGAGRVAEQLGYLPLALDQAWRLHRADAYLVQRISGAPGGGPGAASRQGQRTRLPRPGRERLAVVGRQGRRAAPGAVELLELCAFLAAEPIPRELLGRVAPLAEELALNRSLASVAADPLELNGALGWLNRYGLVRLSKDSVEVHRLHRAGHT